MKMCNKMCNQCSSKPSKYFTKEDRKKVLQYIVNNHVQGFNGTTREMIQLKFDLTRRQVYNCIQEMINEGKVNNIGKSVKLLIPTKKTLDWYRDHFGNLHLQDVYANKIFDRVHAVQITQPLIFRPKNVVPIDFKESKKSHKNNWKSPQLTYRDKIVSIRIVPKKIIYNFKECYGPDPHHVVAICLKKSIEYAKALIAQGFKIDWANQCVTGQEHAIFNKEFAKFTCKYNIHYKSDRLVFDSSIAQNEFELVHPEYSPDDFLKLTDFFEFIIREKIDINILKKLCLMYPLIEAKLFNIDNELHNKRYLVESVTHPVYSSVFEY